MDASVAGTLLNAIDSIHNANAVVINPVYKIPAKAVGLVKIGVKLGIVGAQVSALFNRGDNSNITKDAKATTISLMADTGKAASGCFLINSSNCKYPKPNPMGCAKDNASPIVGAPPAPCSSTIATPVTATAAGTNLIKLKGTAIFDVWTRVHSATIATKTQWSVQMTHDRLAVVDNKPNVCPKYPKATHDPHMAAPLAVSILIIPRRTAFTAPGSKANAATLNLDSAYKEESTPGSAMTNLAAAKLDAHKAHSTTTTPRQSKPSIKLFSELLVISLTGASSTKLSVDDNSSSCDFCCDAMPLLSKVNPSDSSSGSNFTLTSVFSFFVDDICSAPRLCFLMTLLLFC
mmetsp:Transcript_25642/g.36166  ORF Transcript_25642/g.36166 Transcript_25642/m.36166 type:complete len:347 (-) Transcript_25642:355-1395(-)